MMKKSSIRSASAARFSAPIDREELTAPLHRADLEMYAFKTGEEKADGAILDEDEPAEDGRGQKTLAPSLELMRHAVLPAQFHFLEKAGAGSGDRTRILSLEGSDSTIELYPPELP